MGREIERKFLVKNIPLDIEKYEHNYIVQAYLSFMPEVRIRNIDDKHYYLTFKNEGTLSRQEYEIEIQRNTYQDLYEKIQGKALLKCRYKIPLDSGEIAELDIYINIDGLVVVEVEFSSIETASNFRVPTWFGKEVTYDKQYKNKNLALRGK